MTDSSAGETADAETRFVESEPSSDHLPVDDVPGAPVENARVFLTCYITIMLNAVGV
jgi:hypothetical protein